METKRLNDIITRSFDSLGNAIVNIDILHHEIHEGSVFTAARSTTTLGASSWISIRINTSSDYYTHLKQLYANNSGGIGKLEILEGHSTGSTMAVGTTALDAINLNRNSTKVFHSGMGIDHSLCFSVDSTWTSTQFQILTNVNFGSTGSVIAKTSFPFEGNVEFVLKPATTYVVTLYNLSSNAGYGCLKFFMYESTKGEI
jgi:hypothetical protein